MTISNRKLKITAALLWLFGLLSVQSFAQVCNNQQDNFWAFGIDANLDFTTTPTAPATNFGALTGALEGCASVADPNGNLLFSTNGRDIAGPAMGNLNVIYPSNHTQLRGGSSSTHAAVVAPNPNNPNLPNGQQEYYIFTAGDEVNSQEGINVVNVSLQNNTATVSPPTNLLPAGQNTEKLAVARHANCKDYWVVTHDFSASPTSNTGKQYIAYHVDQNGVNAGVSSLQATSHVTAAGRDGSMRGQLSFSEDYTTLVAAVFGEVEINDPYNPQINVGGFIEITDFDKATGVVTSNLVLHLDEANPYGVCLSPSKRYLYATLRDFSNKPARDRFVCYDLQAVGGTVQDILNTETEISLAGTFVGSLSLGQLKIGTARKPNANGIIEDQKKLYLAIHREGVIELDPENPSNYSQTAFPTFDDVFQINSVLFGLPQTIPDYCEPSVRAIASPESFCIGEQVSVWADPIGGVTEPVQYLWSTGQTAVAIVDNPQQSTTYNVTMSDYYGCTATAAAEVTPIGYIATSAFHFEDASGAVKTRFVCGEDVFLNGFASTHVANHFLDLWEVTSSGITPIASAGWQGGNITTRYDLDDLFGVTFQAGKIYQVKLAVQNLPCTGWDEMVLNFTVTTPTLDPDFLNFFSGGTGTHVTIDLIANTNPIAVEHRWIIKEVGQITPILDTGWDINYATYTYTVLQGDYTIEHLVRNVDCGVSATKTKSLDLYWESEGKKSNVVQLGHKTATFDVELYPNPATDLINIVTKQPLENIRVLDIHGRTIKQLHGSETAIPVHDLATGVYIVELTTAQEVARKQFIKK